MIEKITKSEFTRLLESTDVANLFANSMIFRKEVEIKFVDFCKMIAKNHREKLVFKKSFLLRGFSSCQYYYSGNILIMRELKTKITKVFVMKEVQNG